MLLFGTRAGLEEVALKLRLPAAVSKSPTVKARAAVEVSSLIVWLAMVEMVGGSLTGLTVRTKLLLRTFTPSLTLTVINVVPTWLVAGVTVTARLVPLPPKTMLALGTNVRLVDVALRVRLPAAVSTSPIMNAMGPVEVSSLTVWLPMAEMVGGSLTAFTVTRKVVLVPAERFGSVRERVMMALTDLLGGGVIVTLRLVPLP